MAQNHIEQLYQAVLEGDREIARESTEAALSEGIPAAQILNEGMIAAMKEVGRLFEDGEYFVPEMLIAARAMKEALALLKPHLAQAAVKSAGKVVSGTVSGDLHDIGKNLVSVMLEGAGFEIADLGTDVPPEKFVEAVRDHQPDIVAMSALLTTTMPNMRNTIEALEQSGLRDRVKVIVGGAPLTDRYAKEIGADGYAADASRAVALAREMVGRE